MCFGENLHDARARLAVRVKASYRVKARLRVRLKIRGYDLAQGEVGLKERLSLQ